MKKYLFLIVGLLFLSLLSLGIFIPWLISNSDFPVYVNVGGCCGIFLIYLFIAEGIYAHVRKKIDEKKGFKD